MLFQKTNLNTFIRIEMQSMSSNHIGIKLEINNKEFLEIHKFVEI